MKGLVLRIATGGAVGALLTTLVALPAAADVTPTLAPIVSVANPQPGDYVRRGQEWIDGIACDPNAPLGDATAGIARVAVFLGDRDTTEGVPWWRPGGYMGSASVSGTVIGFSDNTAQNSRLGITSPDTSSCKQTYAGWRVLPASFRKGTYTMNVYVLAKNGKETKVTIPGLRIDKP